MKILILIAAIAIYTGRVIETRGFLPIHHGHHINLD